MVYTVEIYTGTVRGAGTKAQVSIHLFGSRGDSGARELHKSVTSNKTLYRAGHMDAFEVEAVSLEDITSVILEHDATKPGIFMALYIGLMDHANTIYPKSHNF